jgi:hypothetical protein
MTHQFSGRTEAFGLHPFFRSNIESCQTGYAWCFDLNGPGRQLPARNRFDPMDNLLKVNDYSNSHSVLCVSVRAVYSSVACRTEPIGNYRQLLLAGETCRRAVAG